MNTIERVRKTVRGSTAVLAATTIVMAGPAMAAVTETVTEDSLGATWHLNDTRSGGSVAFIEDATAPLGGALQLSTTDSAGGANEAKAQLFNYDHIGTRLDEVDAISYSEYRDGASTNPSAQRVSLNLEVDYVGDGSSYTTLVFEPVYNTYQQSLALDTWQTWDAIDGGQGVWWSTRAIPGVCESSCFVSWNTILTNNPDAVIKYAVGVNVGSGWTGDFTGRMDALTFDDVTYDFEPKAFVKDDCKDGGWESLADDDGRPFVNQGDCVSYYASDGRTRGPNR